MVAEQYQKKVIRVLAMQMIYLDHALDGARQRGDLQQVGQLWFQRHRCQSYRSALLRELWLAHKEARHDEALRTSGV